MVDGNTIHSTAWLDLEAMVDTTNSAVIQRTAIMARRSACPQADAYTAKPEAASTLDCRTMPIAPGWQTENRPPRILIVDDDFEIADPVKFALQKLGYEVTHVPDGNQGVAAIATVNPDLMVLDMMMPGRSGFLVLEHLRSSKKSDVRVIMVTGNEGERHQAYARMLGADDYIHKPFAMDRLVQSVQKLLDEPFADGEIKAATESETE